MSVEFIYDRNCPNVAAARTNLMRAFAEKGISAKWTEWERSSPDTPAYAREFGSPAILVNGRDVAGLAPNTGDACRIYQVASGISSGVPSVELIVHALSNPDQESRGRSNGRPLKEQLRLIPAVLFAVL